MRIVICDTGPILHLREADCFFLLQLTGSIYVPPAVDAEMEDLDPLWASDRPGWIQSVSLDSDRLAEARSWVQAGLLDPGEAEAVALAGQMGADWLLTDDAAARTVAQHQGFEVHGSLGVVLWAAVADQLDREGADRALEALSQSSLWVSAQVLSEARRALERIFASASF